MALFHQPVFEDVINERKYIIGQGHNSVYNINLICRSALDGQSMTRSWSAMTGKKTQVPYLRNCELMIMLYKSVVFEDVTEA